ncbi:MAG: flavodoxin [Candidatus Omnitrophica bacterium]|jgi:flavodoxin|nr:flavodoxin [Candidatus Omnitrophota bacterium]
MIKCVIVYFSLSGNTAAVARALADSIKTIAQVDTIRLVPQRKDFGFCKQAFRALIGSREKIGNVNFDLSGYNLVCLGSPVWAFGPAPSMNTYLDKCRGLKGKEAVVFTTYGSGIGNKRCLEYMKNILYKKGVKKCLSFTLQGCLAKDGCFAGSVVKHCVQGLCADLKYPSR